MLKFHVLILLIALPIAAIGAGCEEEGKEYRICNAMLPLKALKIGIKGEANHILPEGEYNLNLRIDSDELKITWTLSEEGIVNDDDELNEYISQNHQGYRVFIDAQNYPSITVDISFMCPSKPIYNFSGELFFGSHYIDEFSITPYYKDDPDEPNREGCGYCWRIDNEPPEFTIPQIIN